MKRKTIIIICAIVLVLILVIPMPIAPCLDGGTREYVALTYKVVDWHHLYGDVKIFDETKIYFFPDNFASITELANRELGGIYDDILNNSSNEE